jgi:hypothetical protein
MEEIHVGVDRATAYALLRRVARGNIDRFVAGRRLSKALTSLRSTLNYGPPGGMTPLQFHDLTFKLQQLHNLLIGLSRSAKAEKTDRLPFFSQYIKCIRESAGDVHSVIEFVVLSPDQARKVMRQLIGYCITEGCEGRMEPLTQADACTPSPKTQVSADPVEVQCPVCKAVRHKEELV